MIVFLHVVFFKELVFFLLIQLPILPLPFSLSAILI